MEPNYLDGSFYQGTNVKYSEIGELLDTDPKIYFAQENLRYVPIKSGYALVPMDTENNYPEYKLDGLPPGMEYGPFDIRDLDIDIGPNPEFPEMKFKVDANQIDIADDDFAAFVLSFVERFASAESYQVLFGDMQERHHNNTKKYGINKARRTFVSNLSRTALNCVVQLFHGVILYLFKIVGIDKLIRIIYQRLSGS